MVRTRILCGGGRERRGRMRDLEINGSSTMEDDVDLFDQHLSFLGGNTQSL